ncbi:Phosphoacetylglucosamine mutase [Aphelenchoides bicaudatus]|nr:Phosphoacetylglucosamine mutase [Aphelenchoides bicaudatus]
MAESKKVARFTTNNAQVPSKYTRSGNTTHLAVQEPADSRQFSYGTAGFRSKDTYMPFIAYRTGVFAGYRARKLGKTIGLVITASHNPYADNGIKLVDPLGEMLNVAFEDQLTQLINKTDEDFEKAVMEFEKNSPAPNSNVLIQIGWDTRPSSKYLASAASTAIEQTGVKFIANGEVTTPQIHYKVRATNDSSYGPIDSFTQRFIDAVDFMIEQAKGEYTSKVYIDCANGVGSLWVNQYTNKLAQPIIDAEMLNVNTSNHELLNQSCGADFVKIEQKMPVNFENIPPNSRCCALDGDADRLIYFYVHKDTNEFHLLDGDHIAALFATFIMSHICPLGLQKEFTFGVIQTAYANGNSTRYFRNKLKCEVVCVKTGTKYLQQAARDFDIAVHFEANGHGTVALSDRFRDQIEKLYSKQKDDVELKSRLYAFTRIINECVGDGIADMLAVEQILRYNDWSIERWEQETYQNAHCVQLKIPVENRDLYECSPNSETILIKPPHIQKQIDEILSNYKDARGFARPSGTENILRVYAEGQSIQDANAIAEQIKEALLSC